MSKSLEALEHLVDGNLNEVNYYRQFCNSIIYIMKDKETIEKELKALEIIKEIVKETISDWGNVDFNINDYPLLKEVLL